MYCVIVVVLIQVYFVARGLVEVEGVEGLVSEVGGAVNEEDDGTSLLCGVPESMFVRGGLVG